PYKPTATYRKTAEGVNRNTDALGTHLPPDVARPPLTPDEPVCSLPTRLRRRVEGGRDGGTWVSHSVACGRGGLLRRRSLHPGMAQFADHLGNASFNRSCRLCVHDQRGRLRQRDVSDSTMGHYRWSLPHG